MTEDIELERFKEEVELKLEEILPRLKTDEGRIAVETYTKEILKISQHPLGIKLLLLFKKYQLDDYSILRGVANTIGLLDSEDLLNLDALLLLVMVKYTIFEKLGPIIGVAEEYNRPETYSKMLQYIGLKARHEGSYEKFHEFLTVLKPWEVHSKTVMNIRNKYNAKEHHLPKEFTTEIPGAALYQKYKDSFHLLNPTTKQPIELNPAQSSKEEIPAVLAGVK